MKVRDLGADDVHIKKVKGHATQADVDQSNIAAWQRSGNEQADFFARKGSALAGELSSTEVDKEHFRLARKWYSWLALLVANWPKDTQSTGRKRRCSGGAEEDAAPKRKQRRRGTAAEENAAPRRMPASRANFGTGHRLLRSGALTWCRICGAYAQVRLRSLRFPCTGSAAGGPRAGQLARLLRGEHPVRKGVRLPRPVSVN